MVFEEKMYVFFSIVYHKGTLQIDRAAVSEVGNTSDSQQQVTYSKKKKTMAMKENKHGFFSSLF